MLYCIISLLFILYLTVNIVVGFLWLWMFVEGDHGTPGLVVPDAIEANCREVLDPYVWLCWALFASALTLAGGYMIGMQFGMRVRHRREVVLGYGSIGSDKSVNGRERATDVSDSKIRGIQKAEADLLLV